MQKNSEIILFNIKGNNFKKILKFNKIDSRLIFRRLLKKI